MSIYNDTEHQRKYFDNSISAFHIGHGYLLSVAHNLRTEAELFPSMAEDQFQKDIISKCTPSEQRLFYKCFTYDSHTHKRYLRLVAENDKSLLIAALQRINFDTRWVKFHETGLCKPFLLVNFHTPQFYKSAALTRLFSPAHFLHEAHLNRYTFLIAVELVHAYYAEDVALYKIVATPSRIIRKLPVADVSFDFFSLDTPFYCVQSAPNGTHLGRMLYSTEVKGLLHHHAIHQDRIEGPVFFEGLRYLLQGNFRNDSSGAPYFIYDAASSSFKVNAIQSEASALPLSITGQQESDFQLVNAIASPLSTIREDLLRRIS